MADETQDLENQLNLQRELNRVIAERQGLINQQTSSMGNQANLAQSLNALFGQVSAGAKDSATDGANLADAMARAQEAASGTDGSTSNLADALRNAASESDQLAESQSGMWDKFKEGVENAKNLGDIFEAIKDVAPFGGIADRLNEGGTAAKALGAALAGISLGDLSQAFTSTFSQIGSVITGAFSAVQNIGMGIFGALSGAMGLLAEAGHQAGSGGVEVANAWEGVAKSVSKVGPGYEAVQGAVENLGMAGASTGAMFGSGPGGMAAAIGYAGEVAAGLGATLGKVADDFAKNIDSYVIANKALGIEAEAMTNMQLMATHSGKDLSTMLDEVAVASVHLSQQFGVDAKLIGKNLNDMTSDYATFGGLSVKELTSTAAYAAKLGIAMKDLQGITAKTDDFEGAAGAASELASTFGMTVDTMELMNADPAEKAEMIRQSFLETGQSFEDMSRQEKARMADITGMSQEALAGAFDPENAELGLEDFNSAADAAAAGAISQEEANLILAKSIDKVHEALGGGSEQLGGPFSAFFDGVTKGITNSEEFIKLAQNFYGVMEKMHAAGVKIGEAFVKAFPGVKDLLTGLADLFDPAKWEAMMEKVIAVFDTFFADLATDPQAAVQTLMDSLMGIFGDFMGENGEAVGMMKQGAIDMINAIGGIISGMIPWLTEKLVEAISGMADALSGSGKETDRNSIGGALMGAFGDAFSALGDALPDIAIALFKGLAQVMWAHKGKVLMALGLVAGWMALQFAFQLGKAMLFEYLKAKIMNRLGKQMQDDAPSPDQAPGPSKSIMESMGETIKEIGKISLTDVAKAIGIAAMLVVFIGVSMIGMAYAIAKAATILGPIPFEDIAKAIIAMAAAVAGVWVLAKIGKTLKINVLVQGGLGMLAGALFLAVAGSAFAGALWVIDKILTGIDFMRVVELLGMIGIATVAVGVAALAGMLLIADGGTILFFGGLGMLAAAAFLFIAGGAFSLALAEVVKVFEGIDLMRVIGILGTLGLTMLAVGGLAVGGAILTAAIPVLLMAVPGLHAGADLLVVAGGVFAEALAKLVKTFDGMPGGMEKIDKAIGIMGGALKSIGGLAFLGAVFRVFMPVVKFIQSGITAAADFAQTAFQDVGRVIDAIAAVEIVDPDRVGKIVTIVGAVIEATAAIGGLGLDMAMVGAAGEIFGDMSMDDMVNMSVRFIEAVGDTMKGMIKLLVKMAGGMDEKALKGAEAIAGMLGGMAALASAMSGPITAVVENHGAMDTIVGAITGKGVDEKLKSVVGAMTQLLRSIGPVIPGLVKAMAKGLKHMPAGMGEKAKAFGDVISGVAKILKVWQEHSEALASDIMGGGEIAAESTSLGLMMGRIADIIALPVWQRTADAMVSAGSLTIDPEAAQGWMTSARTLGTMSGGIVQSLNDIVDSGIFEINSEGVAMGMTHIAEIITAYNSQADSLSSITPLNIDAVLEQVNESLRVKRDKITIADGNVTINMSLNVTMKAEDVAMPLIESDLVLKGSSPKVSSLGSSTV